MNSVRFNEMLKESGAGISTGEDLDTSPGFGFYIESYIGGLSGREGSLEEQSILFGKMYEYRFNYKSLREKIESLSKDEGYQFQNQLTAINL